MRGLTLDPTPPLAKIHTQLNPSKILVYVSMQWTAAGVYNDVSNVSVTEHPYSTMPFTLVTESSSSFGLNPQIIMVRSFVNLRPVDSDRDTQPENLYLP